MKTRLIRIIIGIIIIFVLPFISVSPTRASTITVDTLADENDGSCVDGDCSLRDAIQVANVGDTINFSVNGTITLIMGQLTVDKQLTINGPDWDHLTITGNQATRVFNITAPGNLTLTGVTIRGGTFTGGGIYNFGTVIATGVVIVDNHFASGHGGGINNQGTLTLISASISWNSASGDGGGIYNQGTLNAQRTTFYQNTANYGGGIKNENGTATLTNCTFYQNKANIRGGGVDSGSNSTLTIVNSTFYNNTGGYGLGNPSSTTTITNTIIASNTGGDCTGQAFTLQSNHNMSTDNKCTPGFTQVTANTLKLYWAGFPVLLKPGSVAIDAGTNDGCPTIDQMGTSRPQDGDLNGSAICDIGADEIIVYGTYLPLTVK